MTAFGVVFEEGLVVLPRGLVVFVQGGLLFVEGLVLGWWDDVDGGGGAGSLRQT